MNGDLQQAQQNQVVANPGNLLMDQNAMKHMMDVSTFMSKGTLTLPEPYRNNPANCLAVVMQAAQWNMNPFAVAQKTHFVNGNIGYEAQLVAAVINNSNATQGTFKFEWFGDWAKIIGKFEERESKTKKDDNGYFKKYKVPGWKLADEEGLGVRVSATLRNETEPRVLELLLMQANVRNSTLWADDPRQQLAYLGQKRWARLYAPGVILGVYTSDELDNPATEIDVTPNSTSSAPSEPAKPTYLDDATFKGIADKYKDSVASGKKTIDGFITWIESKGALMTDTQKAEVEAWVKKPVTVDGEAIKVDDPFVADIEKAEGATSDGQP